MPNNVRRTWKEAAVDRPTFEELSVLLQATLKVRGIEKYNTVDFDVEAIELANQEFYKNMYSRTPMDDPQQYGKTPAVKGQQKYVDCFVCLV